MFFLSLLVLLQLYFIYVLGVKTGNGAAKKYIGRGSFNNGGNYCSSGHFLRRMC